MCQLLSKLLSLKCSLDGLVTIVTNGIACVHCRSYAGSQPTECGIFCYRSRNRIGVSSVPIDNGVLGTVKVDQDSRRGSA
jgi:hypothetical protein